MSEGKKNGSGGPDDVGDEAERVSRAAQAAAARQEMMRARFRLAKKNGVIQLPPQEGINPGEPSPRVGLRLTINPKAKDFDEELQEALRPISLPGFGQPVAVITTILGGILAEHFPDLVAGHGDGPLGAVPVLVTRVGAQVVISVHDLSGKTYHGPAAILELRGPDFYTYRLEEGQDMWTLHAQQRVIRPGAIDLIPHQLRTGEPEFFAILDPGEIPTEEPT